MIDSKSPIYRSTKMSSLVRSPIPTNKPSPKLPPTPSNGPYYSPRQEPYYKVDEPLRRTSVLYDSEKSSPHIKRETLPPVMHHRSNSNSSHKKSPIENSAADTLMSMAQQRNTFPPQKRVLEMADDEDDEDTESKKPRSENSRLVSV